MAQLGLDTRISNVRSVSGGSTTWPANLRSLLRAALHSAGNPFGTAALLDTGTTAGRLPLLGTGGRVADAVVPSFGAGLVTGTLITPDTLTEAQDASSRNQIPSLSMSKLTTGNLRYQDIPPFGPFKISGRLARDLLPTTAAGGAAITAVRARTYFTADHSTSTTRFQDASFNRTVTLSFTRAGGTLTVTLTVTARLRRRGQDGGGP